VGGGGRVAAAVDGTRARARTCWLHRPAGALAAGGCCALRAAPAAGGSAGPPRGPGGASFAAASCRQPPGAAAVAGAGALPRAVQPAARDALRPAAAPCRRQVPVEAGAAAAEQHGCLLPGLRRDQAGGAARGACAVQGQIGRARAGARRLCHARPSTQAARRAQRRPSRPPASTQRPAVPAGSRGCTSHHPTTTTSRPPPPLRPSSSAPLQDLWSGNIASVNGRPAVYDPACYYGHHEAEFGMSWCAGEGPAGCGQACQLSQEPRTCASPGQLLRLARRRRPCPESLLLPAACAPARHPPPPPASACPCQASTSPSTARTTSSSPRRPGTQTGSSCTVSGLGVPAPDIHVQKPAPGG
jgi:hypothetical protein